jgi:hypothetical protein
VPVIQNPYGLRILVLVEFSKLGQGKLEDASLLERIDIGRVIKPGCDDVLEDFGLVDGVARVCEIGLRNWSYVDQIAGIIVCTFDISRVIILMDGWGVKLHVG